jgi:hypothetical protein
MNSNRRRIVHGQQHRKYRRRRGVSNPTRSFRQDDGHHGNNNIWNGALGALAQLYRPLRFRLAIAALHALATAVLSLNFPDELDHYYYYF